MNGVPKIALCCAYIFIMLASQVHQATGTIDINSINNHINSVQGVAEIPSNVNQNCNAGHRTTAVSDCLGYLIKNDEEYILIELAVSGTYVLYDFMYQWRPGVVANLQLFGIIGYAFVIETENNKPKVYLVFVNICPIIVFVSNEAVQVDGAINFYGNVLYAAIAAFSTPNNSSCSTISGTANSVIPTMRANNGGATTLDLSTTISILFNELGISASQLKQQIQNTCPTNGSNVNITISGNSVLITEPNSDRVNCNYPASTVTAEQIIQKTGFSIDALIAKGGYGACALTTAFALELNTIGPITYCGSLKRVFFTTQGLIARIDGGGCVYHGFYSLLAAACGK